jgi:hypothetical protein
MEQVATWFLDQGVESGAMDLVLDLTNPVPAVTTLKLMGLPCENWHHYAEVFHGIVAYGRGTPEHRRALALIPT